MTKSEKDEWDHIQSLDFPDREFHEKIFKELRKKRKDKQNGK